MIWTGGPRPLRARCAMSRAAGGSFREVKAGEGWNVYTMAQALLRCDMIPGEAITMTRDYL